ncbi:SCO3374 family protein [Streptomyces sp. NPDC047097]|uniref:SCO3374 family protein n=1 Tax=Streptomyces sp. NPDC047097 TaxID=3155260 RepID=UPI0033CDE49A
MVVDMVVNSVTGPGMEGHPPVAHAVGVCPPLVRVVPVPRPRRGEAPGARTAAGREVARWYAGRLGWEVAVGADADGGGARLVTGVRFDVLELPAEAGHAVLRLLGGGRPGWPVAVAGERMRMLVAPGGAEELPDLLDWLEWRGITLDLTALGAGGLMDAPLPPGWVTGARDGRSGSAAPGGRWLRPPLPGVALERVLPAVPGTPDGPGRPGGAAAAGDGAPCLVRLVAAAAAECHRVRCGRHRRPGAEPAGWPAQPFAAS